VPDQVGEVLPVREDAGEIVVHDVPCRDGHLYLRPLVHVREGAVLGRFFLARPPEGEEGVVVDAVDDAEELCFEALWSAETRVAVDVAVVRSCEDEQVFVSGWQVGGQRCRQEIEHEISFGLVFRDRLFDSLIFGDVVDHLLEARPVDHHTPVIVRCRRAAKGLLLLFEDGQHTCIVVNVCRLRAVHVQRSVVVAHNFVAERLRHDVGEDGVAARIASFVGDVHFGEDVQLEIELSVASHSTRTGDVIPHLQVSAN
jgi:hypothetical protein